MRSASSVVPSTGPLAYASLTRIALNEKPSTPAIAHSGPSQPWRGGIAARAPSVPADDATPGGEQDHEAERDPVPRERHEVVVAHVAQQPADAQERRHEGRREADAEARQILRREQRAVADELVRARGEQRRDREEE